tara:strand:- start:2125 stop:2292 length:168 start_codon:yes stop_codon:yes gene_type:complete
MTKKIIPLFLLIGFASGQFDFSLEDLNPSSESYGLEVGPSFFEEHVTLNYFGYFY